MNLLNKLPYELRDNISKYSLNFHDEYLVGSIFKTKSHKSWFYADDTTEWYYPKCAFCSLKEDFFTYQENGEYYFAVTSTNPLRTEICCSEECSIQLMKYNEEKMDIEEFMYVFTDWINDQ